MKFKFIPNHTLTALFKTIIYIIIISGVFFGFNSLTKALNGEKLMISYSLMAAFCAIFLHFYDKEEKQ